eukprot:438255_1
MEQNMNMYGGGDEYDSDYESEVSVSSIGGEAVSDFEYEDDDNNGHMDCTVPTDLPPLPDNLSALFVLPSCPEHLSQLPPFLSIAERDNDIDMDPVHAENDDSNGVQTEEQIQQRDNEIISYKRHANTTWTRYIYREQSSRYHCERMINKTRYWCDEEF